MFLNHLQGSDERVQLDDSLGDSQLLDSSHVVDDEDEWLHDDQAAPSSSSPVPLQQAHQPGEILSSVSDLVVWRVPHVHPHRLRRPLHHSDSLTGADFACSIYSVTACPDEEMMIVQRLPKDIALMEIFGSTVEPQDLVSSLKLWTVNEKLRFESGLSGCGEGWWFGKLDWVTNSLQLRMLRMNFCKRFGLAYLKNLTF